MKILFLCHRIPYPPNKGDKIRSYNEIKYLSKEHEIHLATTIDDPNDHQYADELLDYCRKIKYIYLNKTLAKVKGLISLMKGQSISVGYFHSSKLQATTNRWLAKYSYDAIICFSSPMAEYLFRSPILRSRFFVESLAKEKESKIENRKPKIVMDFCDLDSEKWLQYSQTSYFPLDFIYGIENCRLIKYEKLINQSFDHSVFVSQQEADLLFNKYPQANNVSIIPNGVDYEYFSPDSKTPNPEPRTSYPILLFTGAMDYHANTEGVEWFSKDIFPMIASGSKKTQFYIVGSNPISKIKTLDNSNGIKVTGFVEDIRPFYEKADICVVPLRIARGIQNKILEAMAMGKAVVTTSKAAEGISVEPGNHLMIEDTPKGFAHAVSYLIKNKEAAIQIGSNARKFVIENHNWPENMKKFEILLK